LAGRLPYDAGSLTELAMLQQREYPMRLDEIAPEVPPALALAVEKSLALAPADRYASADELRAALHDGARGIAPAGAGAGAGADQTAATALLARDEPTAPTRAVSSRRLQPIAPRDSVAPAEYEPIPEIPPSRRHSPPSGNGGGVGKILGVVLIVAAIAALLAYAIGNSQGSSSVKLSPIDGDTTSQIVEQMNGLIDD